MPTSDELMTIGTFARAVGLTPSALRFYDDCGLLPPAWVDDTNGYRYYDRAQRGRAALLRDLRDMALPLPEVRVALDASADEVARIVRAHVRGVEDRARAARRAAARILSDAGGLPRRCSVSVSGPELASAVRQVSPAAGACDEAPELGCVLVEVADDELRVVATDRYRLAVRVLRPRSVLGPDARILVAAGVLVDLGPWLVGTDEVRLEAVGDELRLEAGVESRAVPTVPGEFPRYESILEGLAPPTTRVVVDRVKLLDLLVDGTGRRVALDVRADGLRVSGVDADGAYAGTALDAICTGEPMRVGFSAELLRAALDASIGPDVMLDLLAADRPVVVRSADQGSFTVLAMPVLLDEPAT